MRKVGIDPGKSGAIVLIDDGELAVVHDMPLIIPKKKGGKTVVDLHKVAYILSSLAPDQVNLELVGPSPAQGASVAFYFGVSFAGVKGVVIGMGLPLKEVRPHAWKVQHGLLGKDKDASRLKAIELYPKMAEFFKRKKDVDRADALFIGLSD